MHAGIALINAARVGDVNGIDQLLASGVDIDFQCSSSGLCAVTEAAAKGKLETLKHLRSRGANLYSVDYVYGYNALMMAILLTGTTSWIGFLTWTTMSACEIMMMRTALQS